MMTPEFAPHAFVCHRMKVLLSAAFLTIALSGNPASAATSLEAVHDAGGAGWTRAPFPSEIEQLFCELVIDRFVPQLLYALDNEGAAHTVRAREGVWVHMPMEGVSTKYAALATDPHTSDVLYAAKANSGIESIHMVDAGNPFTEPVVASGRYIALAADEGKAGCIYAAKESGGVDVIQQKSGAWTSSELKGLEKVQFVALAFDRVLANTLYALGKDGVLYEFKETAGYWFCEFVASPSEGHQYTAMACSGQEAQYLFAARADGGVDAIHLLEDGNWKTDTLVRSGEFVALAADKNIPNYVYAALALPAEP